MMLLIRAGSSPLEKTDFSPDFYSVPQFHLWLLRPAPCSDRPCEWFLLQRDSSNAHHLNNLTCPCHFGLKQAKEVFFFCGVAKLTSVGYFLRCGFSYPTVGPCYHEGPPAQVYIQVCWSKMLCCCFIATPVTIRAVQWTHENSAAPWHTRKGWLTCLWNSEPLNNLKTL